MPTAPHLAHPELAYAAPGGWDDYAGAGLRGFHDDYAAEPWQQQGRVFEPERSFGFRVDGRWVATTAAYTRRMTVPGGTVPVAAVTLVTVQPTYRRRGLMRQMMLHQLDDVHRRGEPVALLWASEATIYGRFGYAHAAPRLLMEGSTRQTAFRRDVDLGGGSVAEVGREDALSVLPGLREGWLADRPGALDRPGQWWATTVHDPEPWRQGRAALRFALYYAADGRPDGYAVFQIRGPRTTSETEVLILEIDAAEPAGYAALWRFVLDLDLVRRFTTEARPLDEPLRHLLDDERAVTASIVDGTYVRLVDLPAALTSRRYATEVDVVVEVTDDVLEHNAGRWRLLGGPDGAQVTRAATGRSPDLSLGVRELGAAYLGGPTLTSLARAGLVREHTSGSVARLSTALLGSRAPHCPDHF